MDWNKLAGWDKSGTLTIENAVIHIATFYSIGIYPLGKIWGFIQKGRKNWKW